LVVTLPGSGLNQIRLWEWVGVVSAALGTGLTFGMRKSLECRKHGQLWGLRLDCFAQYLARANTKEWGVVDGVDIVQTLPDAGARSAIVTGATSTLSMVRPHRMPVMRQGSVADSLASADRVRQIADSLVNIDNAENEAEAAWSRVSVQYL